MVIRNSTAPGVDQVNHALKDLKAARREVFGSSLDVLGLFTGHSDSKSRVADAETALRGAFVGFLERQDRLGPDRDDGLRTRVSDLVRKAAPGVPEEASRIYTQNWYDRTH